MKETRDSLEGIVLNIKTIINEISGLEEDELDIDTNLFSFGLDSLMLVQIKKKIDNMYNIELPVGRLMSDVDTIYKVAEFIREEIIPISNEMPNEVVEHHCVQEFTESEKIEENTNGTVDIEKIISMQLETVSTSLNKLVAQQLNALTQIKEARIVQKGMNKPQANTSKPKINFRAVKLDRDIFSPQQKEFLSEFIKRYNERTKGSKKYTQDNRKVFSDWIASLNFRMDFKELIYPIVASRSQGARFWDVDGNEYLDMAIGYGAHFFGHRPQFIVDALKAQMEEGYETGPQTDLGGEVAALICKLTGAERVAFANTGSESVMAALRIARTVTKRDKVVIFKGAYHGNFDTVLAETAEDGTFPISPGTTQGMVDDIVVLDYAKPESLEIIKQMNDQVAAVMVEPVQSRNPSLQPKAFLKKLRELTNEIGAALIFDEMITGFRICPGGVQEYFGIQADMMTYGKIVGGGMPIGIVAGKAKYLDAVDGGYWKYGDSSYPEREMTYFAGTFCKHPLSLAASRAVLRFIDKDGGQVQREANKLTEYFVNKVNKYFEEDEVPMRVGYFASEFRFESYGKYDLKMLPAEIDILFYLLMEKGIYVWEKRTCFFSVAHTYEDADFFFEKIKESIKEMRAGGFEFKESKKKLIVTDSVSINKYEASKAQKRMFVLSQVENTEIGTHLPLAMILEGKLNIEKVQSTFEEIIRRHEGLRTAFTIENNEILQQINENVPFAIDVIDGKEEELDQIIKDFIKPFDLFKAPLMHGCVVSLSNYKYVLLLDSYHGMADGYSGNIIAREFMMLYEGKTLPQVGAQYKDYLDWIEQYKVSEAYKRKQEFWKDKLPDTMKLLNLPLDRPRPAVNHLNGKTLHSRIDEEFATQIKQFSRKTGNSLYMVLLAAFNILVAKLTGEEEVILGTPVVVRNEERFQNTVGMFTNTLVLDNKVNQKNRVADFMKQLKLSYAMSFENSEYLFEDLVETLNYPTPVNRNPIFDIMFVYENAEDRVVELEGLKYTPYDIELNMALFDLNFEIIEERKGLTLNLYYNCELFEEETVRKWIGYFNEIVHQIMTDIHQPIEVILSDKVTSFAEGINKVRTYNVEQDNKMIVPGNKEDVISEMDSLEVKALEEKLVGIWQEVLGNMPINVHTNFFEMGVRSINALQLADKLKEDYGVSIMDLFKYSTIHDLANHILGKEEKRDKKPSSNLVKTTKLQSQDIAIIGMSGRFPGAKDIPTFWNNLVQGKEGISFFSDEELTEYGIDEETLAQSNYIKAKGVMEDVEYFDSFFFDYSPGEADKMDPQIRIFHEYAWKALEDAGYVPSTYEGVIGVFAGNASNYNWMSHIFKPTNNIEERLEKIALNDKDYMSTRVSYKLNLRGPSYGIQTACSTSLTSVHLACHSILLGECDIALAGGVTIMLPKKTGYYYQEGMILSEDGHCRVFDKDATGTIFSDGVGVVVLKRLDKALEDHDNIYAVIKGSAVNNDANRRVGYTAPSIEGQSEVIKMACENAGIAPETITYVEAHGTGTVLGDPIEVEGLKMAFDTDKRAYCAIGSVKSNIGHLDAAAGVAGLIKTALALKHKMIPPTLHFKNANLKIDFENSPFFVNTDLMKWDRLKDNNKEIPRRAGISSFGFGGTNAHVILEEAPSGEVILKPERVEKVIVLSAKTQSALERSTANLLEYVEENPQVSLDDLSCTLQLGRQAFKHRRFMQVKDVNELKETIQAYNNKTKKVFTHYNKEGLKRVVFMFPGQGAQYVNMAKGLYEKEPVFTKALDKCFTLLRDEIGYKIDLKRYLFARDCIEEAKEVLKQTEVTQVVVFSIEYALAKLLMSLGVQPNAMIGHSLGEYVVACIAGVYGLEDGLKLVVKRAKIMQGMKKGVMLALSLPEDKVRELINEEISIATVNGKENCVVAGPEKEVGIFEEKLNVMAIEYRKLQTSHAFHSKMMEPVLEDFRVVLSGMQFNAPQIPYISNLTGDWIDKEAAATPQYWLDHLRNTVRFNDGLTKLLEEQGIFIEVGPGKTLSSLLKRHELKNEEHYVFNMLRHEKENIEDTMHFANIVGSLWSLGLNIDWKAYQQNRPYHKISLPTYPFLGQKYSLEKANFRQKNSSENKGKLPFERWFHKPYWSIKNLGQKVISSDSRQWLIFAGNDQISHKLIHRLATDKRNVTVVNIDDNFKICKDKFLISPTNKANYMSLFEALAKNNALPTDIIYLWGLEKTSQEILKESLVFYALIYLAQATHKYMKEEQLNMFVVSNKVYAISNEQDVDYRNALLTGPCQVIPKENKNIRCKQIDVILEEESIESIYQELMSDMAEECVAYRKELRFVKGYTSMTYREPESDKIEGLKRQGVYVITGGMGGIGLVLGEYLIKNYAAKVVLIGRSQFLQEDQWSKWSHTHEKDDLTSQRIRQIQKMRTYDGQVLIKCADVSNYYEMLQVIESVEAQFGKINGVIHSAGVQGKGMIQFKTLERAQKVLQPKVQGTLVIDKIFAQRELDLLIICSSMASIIGEVGQVDYVAANSFIDSYVNYVKNKGVYKQVLCVNWDNWEKVGMAVNALAHLNSNMRYMLNVGITPKEGIKALEYALASKESQVIVSVKDIDKQKAISSQGVQLERLNEYLGGENKKQYARPELANDYVAPTNEIEKEIAEIWQQIFSMEKIGIHDDFNELGGDSLYALSIATVMKKKFNVDITDIFNYPTIYQLAQKYSGNHEDLSQRFNKAKEVLPNYFNEELIQSDIRESYIAYEQKNERYKEIDMSVENNYQSILLTGSTGYLGIYLLHEVLMQTDADIYTIVRAKDDVSGEQRLMDKYIGCFGVGSMANVNERVHVIEGDVTKLHFGLEDNVYAQLAHDIDCIINATGKVDHYGKYEAFNRINVESVKYIIEFAGEGRQKDIHHMSTKGVGVGKVEGKQNVLFTEDDMNTYESVTNYYLKTKVEAEALLLEVRKKGINTSLYRIGDIVFDTHNGRFQENIDKNAVYLLVKAMLNLEYIPDITTAFMDLTFVDFVSKAIVKLVTRKELKNESYHLYNPYKIGFSDWQQVFMKHGYKKCAVSLNEFMDYLYNHYDDIEVKEAVQDFIIHSHFLEAADYTNFVLAEKRTSYLLAQCGLKWQKPTEEQLDMMLAYGQKKGFFK